MMSCDLPLVTAISLGLVTAYLLGSIPSAVWIGKSFYGVDVREKGSKNAGATNTIRVLGLLPGLFVLGIDAFIVDQVMSHLDNPLALRTVKRDIARLNTLIHQEEIGIAKASK